MDAKKDQIKRSMYQTFLKAMFIFNLWLKDGLGRVGGTLKGRRKKETGS